MKGIRIYKNDVIIYDTYDKNNEEYKSMEIVSVFSNDEIDDIIETALK